MERIIELSPAWDKRNSDPRKNYGIHGVELRMYLKGELGVVNFVVYTDWQLPHVQKELESKAFLKPTPADVGYHSPKPLYDGQECISSSCKLLDGKPCYYDGSGLQAYDVFDILLKEGSDGVWKNLEERYKDIFGELK